MRGRLFWIAGMVALAAAAPANASITIGQVASTTSGAITCGPSSGAYTQPTVTSGASYVIPAAGRLTAWSTRANSTVNQHLALKIFRPQGGTTYMTVTHDGPRPLTASSVNTFAVSLAVKAGDVLGVDSSATPDFPVACAFAAPGETLWGSFPEDPDDGESAPFFSQPNYRLNASAVFEPSNEFGVAAVRRSKKKGQATITVNLAGPGTIELGGKGLKGQRKSFGEAGGGSLAIKVIPKGKFGKKLSANGKASVNAWLTFTPNGGASASESQRVKLIKKS